MKTLFFSPKGNFFSLLSIIFCLLLSMPVSLLSQCPNPGFPTCQPPSDNAFKVLLVLDESGSVLEVEAAFEDAVNEFARVLNERVTQEGKFEMGIVEFSKQASFEIPFMDVKQSNFREEVGRYLDIDYSPKGNTSYRKALKLVQSIPGVDIIFFISDGSPNFGDNASNLADEIKCAGTYIFGVALGNKIKVQHIKAISGEDELSASKSLIDGADWMQENINGLADALIDLANSIVDDQAPVITCPDQLTVSCDASITPDFTGSPEADDNCTVTAVEHTDVRTEGTCGNDFSITRTWTATDAQGHSSQCQQLIEVVDNTPPVVSCPANTVVSCDTSVEAIGSPTVEDNCDAGPVLTFKDEVVGGDCDWQCQMERIWSITDACGNATTCVQSIEKNITLLIEKTLITEVDGVITPNPIVLGTTRTNLTINQQNIGCILKWMPYRGTIPTALSRGIQSVGDNCQPGTNAVDQTGKITNPLFGEALKLALYLRINPEFGKTKLSDMDCNIPPIVLQNLSNQPDIDEFMSVANKALGNIILVPHLPELLEAFQCINGPLRLCEEVNDSLASDQD